MCALDGSPFTAVVARWRVLLTRRWAGTWICCGLTRSNADHRYPGGRCRGADGGGKTWPETASWCPASWCPASWARGRAARGGMTTTELRGDTAVQSRRAQPVQPSRESYLRLLTELGPQRGGRDPSATSSESKAAQRQFRRSGANFEHRRCRDRPHRARAGVPYKQAFSGLGGAALSRLTPSSQRYYA
jgi:hypothetical protein